ncbi:hypothetical protein [Dactylosporangium sucinum]|uniref:DUF559 domain-containing protein n=2 Tax=Dactylosporangium sucinum TaxID=1424081 RepID=A0A917X4E5_9ACTN|nr:hypothetical protein [Dactylosporangium sucinum]GGM65075.1 hypothetical protein GCM10007977_078190 [Dactylosporangium sucinum]
MARLRLSQKRIIAAAQLGDAGVTRGRLRWELSKGRWQTVLPSVYAMFDGPLQEQQRLIAALLYGGPAAQLTGAAALGVHGLRNVPKDRFIRVLVPVGRRVRSSGFVRIHRTTRPDPFARPNGVLRLTSPARSVVEAGRLCDDRRRVRAMVAESVQSGLCRPDELVRELGRAARAGTAALRASVREVVDGVRSVAEGEARTLLRRSRVLPEMVWNPALSTPAGAPLPTPDGWVADVDLALEIDSRAYHLSPEDWERTMRHHARLAAAGAVVLHFSPRQVRDDPRGFVETVERAYLARLSEGYRSRIHAS